MHLFALEKTGRDHVWPSTAAFSSFSAPAHDGHEERKFFSRAEGFSRYLRTCALDEFDLVHVHDALDATAVRSSGLAGPAIVRTVHHIPDVPNGRLRTAQDQAVTSADEVVVVSRYWQEIVKTQFDRQASLVTNGVDLERGVPPPGFDRDGFRQAIRAGRRFVFLAVGGISPRKGSETLFAALALAAKLANPPPLLVLIGGDSFDTYQDYAKQVLDRASDAGLSPGEHYDVRGPVPPGEVGKWFAVADALVYPSLNEGWGLAILEAMAVGIPVVASDLPVVREFATPDDAVLVPPGDASAFADAMVTVMSDQELRTRLQRRGPLVARRYTWDDLVIRQIEIYGSVLRSSKTG